VAREKVQILKGYYQSSVGG